MHPPPVPPPAHSSSSLLFSPSVTSASLRATETPLAPVESLKVTSGLRNGVGETALLCLPLSFLQHQLHRHEELSEGELCPHWAPLLGCVPIHPSSP